MHIQALALAKALEGHPALHSLCLTYNYHITDGVVDVLTDALKTCPNLREVYIYNTQVSQEAADRMKYAIPTLTMVSAGIL